MPADDGEAAAESIDRPDDRAGLVDAIRRVWSRAGRIGLGARIDSFTVRWTGARGTDDEIRTSVEAWRRDVARAARPSPRDVAITATATDAIERRVHALEAVLTSRARATAEFIYKVQAIRREGWCVTTVGWPEGNLCWRACRDGVFAMQLIGASGASTHILINDENHEPEEFGDLDGLAIHRILRCLGRQLSLAGECGGHRVSAVFRTRLGDAVELEFPIRVDESRGVARPPTDLRLPNFMTGTDRSTFGTARVLVLLDRGCLPGRFDVLDGDGVVRQRTLLREFDRTADGEWLPLVVDQVVSFPGGALPSHGTRVVSAIGTSAEADPLFDYRPSPGLQLYLGVNGESRAYPLLGTSRAALEQEIASRVRPAAAPAGGVRAPLAPPALRASTAADGGGPRPPTRPASIQGGDAPRSSGDAIDGAHGDPRSIGASASPPAAVGTASAASVVALLCVGVLAFLWLRRHRRTGGTGLVALLALATSSCGRPSGDGITIPRDVNIGVTYTDDPSPLRFSVSIDNATASVVGITAIVPSCGCVAHARVPISIDHGERRALEFALAPGRESGEIRHVISLSLEQPARRRIESITVHGTRLPGLLVAPDAPRLAVERDAPAPAADVRLSSSRGLEITYLGDDAERSRISATPVRLSRTSVRVRLVASAPRTTSSEFAVVTFDLLDGTRRCSVPVRVSVEAPASRPTMDGREVALGYVHGPTVVRDVEIRCAGGAEPRPSIELVGLDGVGEIVASDGFGFRVRLELRLRAGAGEFAGTLRVRVPRAPPVVVDFPVTGYSAG